MADSTPTVVVAEIETQYVFCFGCEWRGGPYGPGSSSSPGWVHSEGTYTDFKTGRQFCADCALLLLSWLYDGMPDQEDPDSPYPAWIDLATVRRP